MIVSHIRGLLFFALMNICESEIVAANRRPENPAEPTGPAAPTKFGSAPDRCPEVKFKLTIQSENLRFNPRCFYHSKACLKW